MGNRLQNLTVNQHNNPTPVHGGGSSLSHDRGIAKDWTYPIRSARKGDYVAILVDHPISHPSSMIAIEMVPGDKESAKWEGFYSHTDVDPQPITGAPIPEGAYAALYAPELGKQPSASPPSSGAGTPGKVFYVARATADIDGTHLHLVEQSNA